MRIAMIGQKGVPATYGGVERHVEEIAVRLVNDGHAVTVYTRPHYTGDRRTSARSLAPRITYYKGIRLVCLPSIPTKHCDAISHTAACTLHALFDGADVVHYHAVGPSLFCWAPRLFGKRVVATIHGRDALRPKWGGFASTCLRLGEWMAVNVPDATISVSESLAATLSKKYGQSVTFVPNGVALVEGADDSVLDHIGVEPGKYILFASRLVPEKGCHYLIEAWDKAGRPLPLVMAGDSSFSPEYVEQIRSMQGGDGVIFPGFIYGEQLASLFRNAGLFVLPSDLEGLPIVLLEALGYGAPVLASDIAPNAEVMGRYGRYFKAGDVEDLQCALTTCLADHTSLQSQADSAAHVIGRDFNWDHVEDETCGIYCDLLGVPREEPACPKVQQPETSERVTWVARSGSRNKTINVG
jgi:glycosyltransferase involved in cell wall biosynthesis